MSYHRLTKVTIKYSLSSKSLVCLHPQLSCVSFDCQLLPPGSRIRWLSQQTRFLHCMDKKT